jgi:uncharacterized membrane protein (DUF4010 family)
MNSELFQQLGVSLLLGLLIGLQRERAEPSVAGIRTFALVAMLGTLCAWLGNAFGDWIVAAGLLGVAAMFVVGYLGRLQQEKNGAGLTTEVAGLLMFGIGVLVVNGPLSVAVVCGGVLAVILQWKQPLHRFATRIGEQDIKAIMQFVLITLVILPVLPNRTYGPFAVLNPFKIWLLVVLIVGLSLAGYVLYKLVSHRAGTLLSGLLGGLVSSTATTVTFARQTKSAGVPAGSAALVIIVASAIMYVRLLVLIGTVAADQFAQLAPPLALMLGWCLVIAVVGNRSARADQSITTPHENPAELKSALGFAALYAFLLVVVAAAKHFFGARGLYVVAGLSGLPDVDAITLSTLHLVGDGQIGTATGWRLIVLASLANFVFKIGLVGALGSRQLLQNIGLRFGLIILGGIGLMLLWPQ